MSIQALRQGASRNPRTVEEARAFVQYVESLFMPWNIDALVDGFTEDCVVRFGTVPEFRGRDALRAFFAARSAKQKGYRLKRRQRGANARLRCRGLGHARGQDRALGSGVQHRACRRGEQRRRRSALN
jgi:hypothetical protein